MNGSYFFYVSKIILNFNFFASKLQIVHNIFNDLDNICLIMF